MSKVLLISLPKKQEKRFESFFKSVGVACDQSPNYEKAFEKIPGSPPTLIIGGHPHRAEELQALQVVLKKESPTTPFMVVLPEQKADLALEAMNAGAFDCLVEPLNSFRVLTAAKRATLSNGRTLFGKKLVERTFPWGTLVFAILGSITLLKGTHARLNGGPADQLNLASATLSGIQWEDRSLWVGNWYDSTVTHYTLVKGLTSKSRALTSNEIFRMQDSQPILVCNTPESLVTVGFDLKFRSHQRAVGLPTLQTAAAPATTPTGLAWDGTALWSSDGQTGLLYKHGPDLRVIDTVRSILPNPSGIAWADRSLYVMGGTPLRLAKLEWAGSSYIWHGPYRLSNFVPPDVTVSGMAVAFDRLWVVTGGSPHMISRSLKDLQGQFEGWKDAN